VNASQLVTPSLPLAHIRQLDLFTTAAMSRLPRSSFMNKARDSVYPTSAAEAGAVGRKSMARSAAEGPEPENALLAECVSNLMRCNISVSRCVSRDTF
jgi:hypothetical protein